jgi:hypothetical protein
MNKQDIFLYLKFLIDRSTLNKNTIDRVFEFMQLEQNKVDTIQEPSHEMYKKAWSIIHSMHTESPKLQFEIFALILRTFSRQKCICGLSGYAQFLGLINGNFVTFESINDSEIYKKFWIYFHDLVNFKLNKPIFNSSGFY